MKISSKRGKNSLAWRKQEGNGSLSKLLQGDLLLLFFFFLFKDQNLTTWNICALACPKYAMSSTLLASVFSPAGTRLVNQQNVSIFRKLPLLFWVGRNRKKKSELCFQKQNRWWLHQHTRPQWPCKSVGGAVSPRRRDSGCARKGRRTAKPHRNSRWFNTWTSDILLTKQIRLWTKSSLKSVWILKIYTSVVKLKCEVTIRTLGC